MEGVFIGFNMLELREEYIKIGELWLNNDGDELYIKPYETSVYFHDIEKNQIQYHKSNHLIHLLKMI